MRESHYPIFRLKYVVAHLISITIVFRASQKTEMPFLGFTVFAFSDDTDLRYNRLAYNK